MVASNVMMGESLCSSNSPPGIIHKHPFDKIKGCYGLKY